MSRLEVIDGASVEVAVAMDPRSLQAIVLGEGLDRDYSTCPSGWICGTKDLTRVGHVTELKTGTAPQDRPERQAQTKSQAVARWLLDGVRPSVRLVWARADGPAIPMWWRPTFGELERHRRALIAMMDRIDAHRDKQPDELPLVTGEHCRYCDVRREDNCPAQRYLRRNEPADAVERYERAVVLGEEAKEARARSLADLDGDKRMDVELSYRRSRIDAELAIERLPGLADFARRTITAGDIDRYIREQPGKFSAVRDDVHAQLGDAITWTATKTRTISRDGDAPESV
jgi:hypothetical protein